MEVIPFISPPFLVPKRLVRHGTMTSDASLRQLNARKICFDVVLRTWRGFERQWSIQVVTASGRSKKRRWRPYACTTLSRSQYPMISRPRIASGWGFTSEASVEQAARFMQPILAGT